jgi:hypothetical protein
MANLSREAPPFNLDYYAAWLADGNHTITVIAEDDIGTRRIAEIPFVLAAGAEPPGAYWVERSLTLNTASFPRTLFLTPVHTDLLREIRVFIVKQDTPKTLIATIGDFSHLFNDTIIIPWTAAPQTGVWTVTAEVLTADGTRRETDAFTAIVE